MLYSLGPFLLNVMGLLAAPAAVSWNDPNDFQNSAAIDHYGRGFSSTNEMISETAATWLRTRGVTYREKHMPGMVIGVGSPPQKITVLLDTGSSDLVLPVTACVTCPGNKIDPILSKTYLRRDAQCSITYLSDDTAIGSIAFDEVRILDYTVPLQRFLAVERFSPDEKVSPGGYDGILGLGFASGMACGGRPLYQNVVQLHEDSANLFAVHFPDDGSASSVTFGTMDMTLLAGPMTFHHVYIPAGRTEPVEWALESSRFRSGEYGVAKNLKIVLDTGAPLMYAHRKIVDSFYGLVPNAYPVGGSYTLPCDVPSDVMVFAIDDQDYAVDPKHFVADRLEDIDGRCWGGLQEAENILEDTVILGGPFFKTFYTVFMAETQQIGLAQKAR